MATKELTNNEHNDKVFAKMEKLKGEIATLKATLKPVEAQKFATLAECNAMAKKKGKK
jgi:hypothetical protein